MLGLILCITEQPSPQSGTCSAQQNRWVFLNHCNLVGINVQLNFLHIFHVTAFGVLDFKAEN